MRNEGLEEAARKFDQMHAAYVDVNSAEPQGVAHDRQRSGRRPGGRVSHSGSGLARSRWRSDAT